MHVGGSIMDKKAIAKSVKLENLYEGELKRFGNKLRGSCPFHDDKLVPNFFIYTQTNSWYCFVCGKGGDVIDFVMRLKKYDFKQALQFLVNL